MTVNELMRLLKDVDGNNLVVLSKDAEGNAYKPLGYYSVSVYKDGEIGLVELTEGAKQFGYTEEDVINDGQKALVLYPID